MGKNRTRNDRERDLDGKVLDKDYRRCQQIKCGYFVSGGCNSCEDCGTKPFVIKTTCSRCLNCSSVEGELRWTDDNNIVREEFNKRMLKEFEQIKKAIEVRR